MDSDANKIFVGGISWETTDEKLKEYFESYGTVVEAVIMKDRTTGRGRGFGFVVFADPDVADRVVQDKHHINGKAVEAKKAVPKDENQNPSRGGAGNVVQPTGGGGSSSSRTKKIFVGGLAPSVTEEEFKAYFEQFGNITDVVVMYDHATQRPRGFGFITFDCEEAVDNVLQKTFHELKGKMVEVKRAVPKDASAPARSPTSAGFPRGPFAAAAAAAAYGQGFPAAAGPYAYGPRAYPSYAGYAGYGYGYPGYGAGAYSPAGATGYCAAAAAAAGYGGAGGAGSFAPAAAGRNSWPNYGTSSPGYGGNGGSMSAYGAGGTAGWASPQQGTNQASGNYVGGYSYAAAGNDGSGGGSGGGGGGGGGSGGYSYGAAAAARSGGYAAAGVYAGNAAPGYGGGGGSYGDGYGYQQDSSWRSGEAYNSTVQSGTPAGFGSSTAAGEPGAGNGAAGGGGYGGYGSRQTQRGLTAA